METTAEETARIRAEVATEMDAEESGDTRIVDESKQDPEMRTETKTVDPWEGVNPALKQMYDDMSVRLTTLQATETRLKQAESRIGAINSELHAAKAAAVATKEAPTAAQMAAAAESDEKWESLKSDFPEWAEAFDSRFDKKLATKVDLLRAELKTEIGSGSMPQDEILRTFETRLLTVLKPKWRETIASNEWKEWLAMQPEQTIALTKSENAEDAIAVLDAFAEAKPQKTATEIATERKQRLNTAILPTGGKAAPVKSEADMNAAELRSTIGKEVYADS